jgi:hypothetical protein
VEVAAVSKGLKNNFRRLKREMAKSKKIVGTEENGDNGGITFSLALFLEETESPFCVLCSLLFKNIRKQFSSMPKLILSGS